MLASVFIVTDKYHARTTSGPLFIFWFALTLTEAFIFGSKVIQATKTVCQIQIVNFLYFRSDCRPALFGCWKKVKLIFL